MNQPPRQETNSQTFFSKPTRNSKTPPNFVPKMTRNHSQEQAPRRPERPFWNPTRKLVWLLLFCYAAAAGAAGPAVPTVPAARLLFLLFLLFLLVYYLTSAGLPCCCCWWLLGLLFLLLLLLLLFLLLYCSCICCCCLVVMLVLASADAAAAPAVPWTSLQRKKPKPDIFFRNHLETAKHHLISCRKWREIIRNNKLPGGRNVPSEILLDIES